MYQFDYERLAQGLLIFFGLFIDEIFSFVKTFLKV